MGNSPNALPFREIQIYHVIGKEAIQSTSRYSYFCSLSLKRVLAEDGQAGQNKIDTKFCPVLNWY